MSFQAIPMLGGKTKIPAERVADVRAVMEGAGMAPEAIVKAFEKHAEILHPPALRNLQGRL